jgi:hypothetical protein
VAISKDFPLKEYPTTRELQVVIEVIEEGPKEKMPREFFACEIHVESSCHQMPTIILMHCGSNLVYGVCTSCKV